MMSNLGSQDGENSGDNVFKGISAREEEASTFRQFLEAHDQSVHTVKALASDLRKFARYFVEVNQEPFSCQRLSQIDLVSFKRHLRESLHQSVATVNRALVSLRKYLEWQATKGFIVNNPAKGVKELHQVKLCPKGLDRPQVRKLLREIELRKDIRANAIFSILLYTGCRVSELAGLELTDLIISERSGSIIFRQGKGNKQRQCPLPLPARQAIKQYLAIRPSIIDKHLIVGERGPLTDRGVRALCRKYSAICGVRIHPHILRHSMAHRFLTDTNNDIVALAQILGHENLNTTSRYSLKRLEQLSEESDKMSF